MIEFIGHFHPLLVHLPIGILLVALLLQWLSRKEKYRSLRPAVAIILLCGTITAAISCLTGYALSISDDYDVATVNWHMWLGLSVLLVSFLLYLKEKNERFAVSKRLLAPSLFVLIAVTGHLGGSLTHGSGYITQPLTNMFTGDTIVNMAIQPLPDVQEALVYNDVIRPILQTKCMSCHNAGKQKGGLRMDEVNLLLKGGKNGKIVEAGNADASEMIRRLLLPTDNDEHMPPKEKPQPSESQVALFHWWISNGADFSKKVKDINQPVKIKPLLTALQQPLVPIKKESDDLPVTAVERADDKVIAALKTKGVIIVPVAQNSNYLTANFVTCPQVALQDIQLLKKLRKQLVWLRLDNTNMGDDAAAELAQLTALTRLNVSNTLLTDKGIKALASLQNLKYLNLTGTKITAEGLKQTGGLPKLKSLYLYKTNINSLEYPGLAKIFPAAVIDTGNYTVEFLATDTSKLTMKK